MRLRDYMEEVVKLNDRLNIDYIPYSFGIRIIDMHCNVVIDETGNCNYKEWNNGWIRKNIQEFHNAGENRVPVRKEFPEPIDFVEFYITVREIHDKEVSTWIVI